MFEGLNLPVASHLAAFLIGALTACAGQYLADKYTDQRRERQAKRAEKKVFKTLQKDMPELLKEMADDLKSDVSKSVREFVVLNSRRNTFNSSKARFAYFHEEHRNLQLKVDRLLSAGLVGDVTVGNTPIYRMEESFVEKLLA